MVLTFGGSSLFEQNDVRETPADLLASKTSYWSVSGSAFQPMNDGATFSKVSNDPAYAVNDAASIVYVPVNLPNGAIVTNVTIYGSNPDPDTWSFALGKVTLSTNAFWSMAGVINSVANSATTATINQATIDNSTYGYYIYLTGLDANFLIYGAVIAYKTEYI